jgi:NDP-sugar pyrophosphorylase family protein
MMQAVILAGGLGTRLLPITRTVPKAMIPIGGRPFLEYQLALLRTRGITDIVLCVGHLGDMIKAYCGDGSRFGLQIRYGDEGHQLLGTAGALKHVEPCLRDEFFVTYGDAYLMLDYRRVMGYFRQNDRLGLMVTYRNQDRYDRSNVVVRGSFVAAYDNQQKLPGMDYIDFGVSVFRREALRRVPPEEPASLEGLYTTLIAQQQLLAYTARRRFYEIGSPGGLAEFRALVRSRLESSSRREHLTVAG